MKFAVPARKGVFFLELLTIKYFLSVAKCLSFSAAAEENHISQSAFSKAIMRLERELDTKLIDRSRHPISLTPAGECFYKRMLSIEPQFQAALDELSAFSGEETLRVLICPRSFQYKIAIDEFLQAETGIRIEVRETSDISQPMAQLKKYDFVITPRPFDLTEDTPATTLYEDTLYILASNLSPLAAQDSVSLKALDGQGFFGGPYSRSLLTELSRRFSFTPSIISPPNGKAMFRQEALYRISKNMGVGIFSGRDLQPYRSAHMVCLPIREVPSFPVLLLQPPDARETPGKARFRAWITENMVKYAPEPLELEKFNRKR